jgi:Outer membrane protein beta-barrel domain
MSAIRSVVLGAVLMATLGAAPAMAQGAKFSLGGGLTLPLGDFGEGAGTGFHGLAAVSFQPGSSPVGIQVDAMYQRFGVEEDPILGDVDANFQLIQGTANAVYRFQSSEDTKIRPYIIGGVGLYNLKLTGDDAPDNLDSNTDFGINGGAGFDFVAGSVGLFVEGRFHNVFSDGESMNFIPITVGVRLGGS